MKGPGSGRKEAPRPANSTELCMTALLRASRAALTSVTAVLGRPPLQMPGMGCGRTPTWRADKASGCHVTRAVAQTGLPPADLPSSFLLSLPLFYSPLPSPPLHDPPSAPGRPLPNRIPREQARPLQSETLPGQGMRRGSMSPPLEEGQKFHS